MLTRRAIIMADPEWDKDPAMSTGHGIPIGRRVTVLKDLDEGPPEDRLMLVRHIEGHGAVWASEMSPAGPVVPMPIPVLS